MATVSNIAKLEWKKHSKQIMMKFRAQEKSNMLN